MAVDLVTAGTSVAAVQVAGRWVSARMPATYARSVTADRGGPLCGRHAEQVEPGDDVGPESPERSGF